MRRPPKVLVAGRTDARVITSADGALTFVVAPSATGVHVERTQAVTGAGTVSHSMRFDGLPTFMLTYEADALQFTYPLVYQQLRRAVEELLDERV